MKNVIRFTKKWWLFTIIGGLITLLGWWVYQNPVENYIALSVLFSIVILISGIFEIFFAVTNSKIIKSWGWMLVTGFFDLVIGIILLSKENLTVELLPIIFGIWIVFRGIAQINKGILIKKTQFKNWGWFVFGGLLVIIFGFFVIFSPQFGVESIVIWTSLTLILLGLLTILFSFIIKKLNHIYND